MKKRMILEIEVDDMPEYEESDFIESLAEDITDGETAKEYYIFFAGWDWSDKTICVTPGK